MLSSALTWARKLLPPGERASPLSGILVPDEVIASERLAGQMPATSRPWRLRLTILLVWTLIALLQATQYYFFPDPVDGPVTWDRALGLGFGLWYTWGLLGLLAFRLSLRFPLGKNHWASGIAVHSIACLVFVMAKIFIDYPIIKGLYCPHPEDLTIPVFLKMSLRGAALRFILYYWAIIAASHGVDYYGKYRDGQLRAAQLEIGLARARLQLLKTQLQPHFLFNTLNAISALVHVDVEAADHTLARLGDLLRLALEDFAVQEAPLARELEIARSYLDIEQARLGSRLRVKWDIAPDISDSLVPTFLLQPLIENAIHHGIAPRIGPGCIEIRAHRRNVELHLEVRDDGPGLSFGKKASGGVGLANTRARLLHLYGTAQRLEIGNRPQGGCVAKIVLPFHELDGELHDTVKEQV
jgi:two-component system LytT family sensor kinase